MSEKIHPIITFGDATNRTSIVVDHITKVHQGGNRVEIYTTDNNLFYHESDEATDVYDAVIDEISKWREG